MSESVSRLRDQLDRRTAAGIVEAGQAARMESAEQARAARRQRVCQRVALRRSWWRVLGYLGAAISISVGFVAVRQVWPGMSSTAMLWFTAVAAVLLLVIGAALRTGGRPAHARLRSVLWLRAAAAGTGCAAIVANEVLGLGDHGLLLTSAAAWAGLAIPLRCFGKSALRHVVMFGGLVALCPPGSTRWNRT